jgi:isoleucyl-tRNA synthetase
MFNSIDTKLDNPKMEQEMLDYWVKNSIFDKLRTLNKNNKKYIFLEGPPTANGHPHIGHALTRSSKDLFIRYNAMQGKNIYPYIAGWDCHGLPVELEIEKLLKINSKREIEQYGVKEFNEKCRASVFKYKDEWERMSKRIGFWIDFENAYITMSQEYIESVWWALKEIWNKGLLVKDYKVVPYCPRCGTPLSSHEVAQGYKETEDPSVYIKFKVVGEDSYFLVWTTTPWTLPSNLLLAVNENVEYVKIESEGERYYLAKALVSSIFEKYKILEEFKGAQLVGMRYERLIDIQDYRENAFYVVSGQFVSIEDGTGIVHIAPAFGIDDFEIAKKERIQLINPLNTEGKFTVGPWKDMFVKDADREIIKHLKSEHKLYKSTKIKHIYPFCWRCDTPLLYFALDTWFIKVSEIRDALIATNENINWIPAHLKNGRFGNFLKDAKDWALSRERYWGTPLPLWRCKNGHYKIIGSFEELRANAINFPEQFDPHRPNVDEIMLKCECGELMKREPYTIDGWFDSGSAPFAQFHYPFEHSSEFKESFPVDFITEAIDQTRGWFYTLHVINNILFNSNAFKNVYTLGFVLNQKGEKMSKSKGDSQDPVEIMDKIGADALRLYLYSTPMWKDKRVSIDLIGEYKSKTIDVLWNVYLFFVNNASLDHFEPPVQNKELHNSLDLWIISRLNSMIAQVRGYMDQYEPHKAVSAIEEFIDNLSNWYLRRSRRRFWDELMSEDKKEGYITLYEVLTTFSKVMAPFTPFISDRLYQDLTGKESVHLELYPVSDAGKININLENEMEIAIKVTELGRRARQLANIKLRQPIKEMIVYSAHNEIVNKMKEIIAEEVNAKSIVIADAPYKSYTLKISLNFKNAGPKFKNNLDQIKQGIETLNADETINTLEKEGKISVNGNIIEQSDLIINKIPLPNYMVQTDKDLEVTINTEIDQSLYLEGLAHEILRRVQTMRKDLSLGYSENIMTVIDSSDTDIIEAVQKYKEYMMKESLSESIEFGQLEGYSKEWNIEDKKLKITIKRV